MSSKIKKITQNPITPLGALLTWIPFLVLAIHKVSNLYATDKIRITKLRETTMLPIVFFLPKVPLLKALLFQ